MIWKDNGAIDFIIPTKLDSTNYKPVTLHSTKIIVPQWKAWSQRCEDHLHHSLPPSW